jgi:hypothetical protein
MPIRFAIDHQRRFVRASAEDNVTLDDIETFLDAVVVADALPYRKLFDGRTAFGKYTNDDLMRLAARMSAYSALERRGAAAIVPSPDYFELAARFVNLAKDDRPVRVFLDVAEAERWLEAQPEIL